jgi:hypothetical protein
MSACSRAIRTTGDQEKRIDVYDERYHANQNLGHFEGVTQARAQRRAQLIDFSRRCVGGATPEEG